MNNTNKKILYEKLNASEKKEVESIIKKEFKTFFGKDFETKVEKIVKAQLKGSEFEDKVVGITRNVLVQLYKSLWTKRQFWTKTLKNKPA